MKKLVKTAKQQFEERLSELRVVERWEMCPTEIYYGCEMPNGVFVLLRDQDGEYKELQYEMRYIDLLMTESFLSVTAERFVNGQVPIRPLFDWYASADHNDEPFNLLDIYMSELEESHYTFEDLYEEVPDVRVITAKEQWEEASADAKVLTLDEEHTLKVKITDKNVVFYRSDDMYARIEYPSLEQMRADTCFVCEVTDSMNEANMQDDIAKFLRWVRVGGDFPIPLSVIFYSDYQNYKFEGYEDKELHQEQTIEEMIALTPEQQDAVKAFEVAFEALKDSGVKIICYTDENDFYAINGNANLEFENLYNDKNGYIEITHTLEDNHRFPFAWNLYWGHDYGFYAKKL